MASRSQATRKATSKVSLMAQSPQKSGSRLHIGFSALSAVQGPRRWPHTQVED